MILELAAQDNKRKTIKEIGGYWTFCEGTPFSWEVVKSCEMWGGRGERKASV